MDQKKTSGFTPEEEKKAQETKKTLASSLENRDIVQINKIIRNPDLRKFLTPDALRQALATLRTMHMEALDKTSDNKALADIKGDVIEELTQVSHGYHELFRNLQGHLDRLEPFSQETESIINLQNEVADAENSVQDLLKNINASNQPPAPLQNGPINEKEQLLT